MLTVCIAFQRAAGAKSDQPSRPLSDGPATQQKEVRPTLRTGGVAGALRKAIGGLEPLAKFTSCV